MKDEQIFKSNDRRRIGCYNQLAVQCQQVAEKFLKGYLDNLFLEEDVTDLLRKHNMKKIAAKLNELKPDLRLDTVKKLKTIK